MEETVEAEMAAILGLIAEKLCEDGNSYDLKVRAGSVAYRLHDRIEVALAEFAVPSGVFKDAA